MKHVICLFLICLMCVACCGTPVKAPAVTETTLAVTYPLHFHADKAFDQEERQAIWDSAEMWRTATQGLADVTVQFDLDFDSVLSLKQHEKDDLILKIDSHNPLVIDEDTGEWAGIWGMTPPWGGIHSRHEGPIRMYLVADALKAGKVYKHVVVHEMGHALGLSHVESPFAMMYAYREPMDPIPACLTKADLSEFCRVNECGHVIMKSCER